MDVTASESPGHGRLRRRRNILIGVVLLALIASVGGLILSTNIKSPTELAAQTSSPGLTRLTTTVQRQVISDTVLAQGAVGKPPEISGPPGGGGGGGGGGGAQPIVTRVFLGPGATVHIGQPIIEVAGRPVFVFQGTYPAYRDLSPGETGPDVAQLQSNLQVLGYSTGADASGVFGAGTSAAVAAFYKNLGYTPPPAGGPKSHGAMVPLSEFFFVPTFPATVASLGAHVGGTASGTLVTLSMGRPGIKGQLNPADAALVRPGMGVTITDSVTGKSRPGTVVSVSSRAKTKGSISGGIYLPMKIQPNRPLPASMIGQNLSLSISAAHSNGPVLTVPEAAVFASADGGTYVSKVTGPSTQVKVAVRVGITGGGLVQVTPLTAGALTAGSVVVTGQGYASSGQYGGRLPRGAKGQGVPVGGQGIVVGPGG